MKRIWMAALLLLLLLITSASAVSSKDYNYNYTVLEDGTIRLDFINRDPGDVLTVPETVDGLKVTAIDGTLFRYMDSVTEIVLPSSVTQVYNDPEDGMDQVILFGRQTKKLTIVGEGSPFTVSEDGLVYLNTRLVGCLNIGFCDNAVIAEGTTAVDLNVFASSRILTSIEIPASLRELKTITEESYLSEYAPEMLLQYIVAEDNPVFHAHDGILYREDTLLSCPPAINSVSLRIPEGTKKIASTAFYNVDGIFQVFLPEGMETIETFAFYSCKNLEKISIPDSMTSIAPGAFRYCWNLSVLQMNPEHPAFWNINGMMISRSDNVLLFSIDDGTGDTLVNIPSGVTGIGHYAFTTNPVMDQVNIPSSVRVIGDSAFSSSGLTSIVIPTTVEKMGKEVFQYCDGLTRVEFEADVLRADRTIPEDTFMMCDNLTDVIFHEDAGLLHVGMYAFYACLKLERISFCDSIESIDSWVFSGCSALKEVKLPENLKELGDCCFYDCTSLKELTIPKNVARIDMGVFSSCSATVYLSANTQVVGSIYQPKVTFVVPADSAALNSCKKQKVAYIVADQQDAVPTPWDELRTSDKGDAFMLGRDLYVVSSNDAQVQALLDAGGKIIFQFRLKEKLSGRCIISTFDWDKYSAAEMVVTYVGPQGQTETVSYATSMNIMLKTDEAGEYVTERLLDPEGSIALADGFISYRINKLDKQIELSTHAWSMTLKGE